MGSMDEERLPKLQVVHVESLGENQTCEYYVLQQNERILKLRPDLGYQDAVKRNNNNA